MRQEPKTLEKLQQVAAALIHLRPSIDARLAREQTLAPAKRGRGVLRIAMGIAWSSRTRMTRQRPRTWSRCTRHLMKPGGVPAASLASASSSSRAPCLMSPPPANTPSPAPQDLSQTCRSKVNKVEGSSATFLGAENGGRGRGGAQGECGGWGLGSGVQWFGIIVESAQ